jgi:hypothetical protein
MVETLARLVSGITAVGSTVTKSVSVTKTTPPAGFDPVMFGSDVSGMLTKLCVVARLSSLC